MDKHYALQVKHLLKKMGKEEIIKDISFELKKGEILGLLGPNGSGKTTLLKLLVGLLAPNQGQIYIEGKNLKTEFEAAIRHIGAIIENPELYDFLSGYDNLVHFYRMVPDLPFGRIVDVIKLLDMEDYIEDKVFTYSLGMRQRLGLAQAILHHPSILLLDEPTNGLDPAGIKDLRMHLKKLSQEQGVSIIISSHILAEIELICDSIMLIHEGVLIEKGRVDDYTQGGADQQIYLIKVEQLEQARRVILMHSLFSQKVFEFKDRGFTIQLTQTEVASLNKLLVQSDISVFGIEQVKQTLETAFFQKVAGNSL